MPESHQLSSPPNVFISFGHSRRLLPTLTSPQWQDFVANVLNAEDWHDFVANALNAEEYRFLLDVVKMGFRYSHVARTHGMTAAEVEDRYISIVRKLEQYPIDAQKRQYPSGITADSHRPDTGQRNVPPSRRTERRLKALSFLVPRKVREPLLGDLLEDLAELRASGAGEWRIRAVVLFQLAIASLQRPRVWLLAALTWLAAALRARIL